MIPLYKPYMPELPLLNEILHSGKLTYGKYGRAFEKELGDFFGNNSILVTNTFSNAILVALSTLELKPGDKVIASPMSCLASTQPLLVMGLKVIWADVDPTIGTLDPDSVRSKMHLKPTVIIHNHFCGYPGHIDEINEIGREYGVPVIDDGIEAFGSKYKGRKIGSIDTDITVFSFTPVRFPNTIDGGAIIFKDRELYQKSLLVRDSGIDRTRFRDDLGEIDPACDINLVGHSATPMELNSSIGLQQMKDVNEILAKQRNNATMWEKKLKDTRGVTLMQNKSKNPNYWVYGILAEKKRATILRYREEGYYASGVHANNNVYSVFGDQSVLPGVKEFNDRFVALPCGWWVKQ